MDIKQYINKCFNFNWNFNQDDTFPSNYKKNLNEYGDLIHHSRETKYHKKVFLRFEDYKNGIEIYPSFKDISIIAELS